MMIFELICEQAHEFEGWFRDHASFQEQLEQALVQCPVCGSSEVGQRLATGGKVRSKQQETAPQNPRGFLKALKNVIETHFEDVGPQFTETALRIHYGAEEPRNIRGTSTESEEKMLKEEGVKFHKVPILSDESKMN